LSLSDQAITHFTCKKCFKINNLHLISPWLISKHQRFYSRLEWKHLFTCLFNDVNESKPFGWGSLSSIGSYWWFQKGYSPIFFKLNLDFGVFQFFDSTPLIKLEWSWRSHFWDFSISLNSISPQDSTDFLVKFIHGITLYIVNKDHQRKFWRELKILSSHSFCLIKLLLNNSTFYFHLKK